MPPAQVQFLLRLAALDPNCDGVIDDLEWAAFESCPQRAEANTYCTVGLALLQADNEQQRIACE